MQPRSGAPTPHHENVLRRRRVCLPRPRLFRSSGPPRKPERLLPRPARGWGGSAAGHDSRADRSAFPPGGEGGAPKAFSASPPSSPGMGLSPHCRFVGNTVPESSPFPSNGGARAGPSSARRRLKIGGPHACDAETLFPDPRPRAPPQVTVLSAQVPVLEVGRKASRVLISFTQVNRKTDFSLSSNRQQGGA